MKKKPTSFLDLPGEIRNEIYSLMFVHRPRPIAWPLNIRKHPSVSRWLNVPLSNVHPQVSREWGSIIINSALFVLDHDTTKEISFQDLVLGDSPGQALGSLRYGFLAKKVQPPRKVRTAEDASDVWRVWIENLEENQAVSVRHMRFVFRHLHQNLSVSVAVDENGQVCELDMTLMQPLYLEKEFVSESKAEEKLKAIGDTLSLNNLKHLDLTRKQLLSRIFWEISQIQIWAYPEYLVWLERHKVTDKRYLDWLKKFNKPFEALNGCWVDEMRMFSLTWERQ